MHPRGPVPHLTHPALLRRARTRVGTLMERTVGALLLPFVLAGALATYLASRAAMAVGVEVNTSVNPAVGGTLDLEPSSTYFVAGLAERGDTAGVELVRSMAEYREKLGARVAYGAVHDDLEVFFAEGGSRVYVARTVGPAATKGSLMLQDRNGVPANTLKIEAADPGAWSSNVTIEVADDIVANTYRLIVRYNGDVVEQFGGLDTPAAAVAALQDSLYVRAIDQGSATAPPNNNPAVIAATALSAGTDDRAAVTGATMVTALDRFGVELGAGAVAIPGQPHSTVAAGLIAHARARRRIALTAPAKGTTVAAAAAAARGLRNTAGAEHGGFFFPWIEVPNGSGGIRTISPEGYVAAVRARAHRQHGPFRAAAGELAASRFVVGTEIDLTAANIDTLDSDAANGIRTVNGVPRLYNWRSLSADEENFKLLTGRDMLNHLAAEGEKRLERFVHETVDPRGHLFAAIEGELDDLVAPLAAAGGLYSKPGPDGEPDGGYRIDTGPAVNTEQTLANNEVRAQLSVRVSPTAQLIRLDIVKAAFRAEL